MQNNFIEITDSCTLDIEASKNISILECLEFDKDLDIIFNVYDDAILNASITSINNNKKKNINISLNLHGKNVNCDLKINSLCLNSSHTKIEANGVTINNLSSGYMNISINGIVDDNNSTMSGIPKFILKNNKVDAHHSLVMGSINQEELFYLRSRCINIKDAKYLLLTSKLFDCLKTLNNDQKEFYKNKILNMWGSKNA
ncbi:MAG: SufD family Fe-S cluster assembly protein [Mycoplasma sp.]